MTDSNADSAVIQIPLLHDQFATIDHVDSDLAEIAWGLQTSGYVIARGNLLHRLILERVLKRSLGKHEIVDHIDQNPLNNCRSNLRLATRAQNGQNRKVNQNNKSGYKGVCLHKRNNTWRASITINGKSKTLGYFKTPELAAEAYNRAALKHFGEFASLNIIRERGESIPHIPKKVFRTRGALSSNDMSAERYGRSVSNRNTSGYKGVSWDKHINKWRVRIMVSGSHISLGCFVDIREAARAYNVAALAYIGEGVKLNKIEEE